MATFLYKTRGNSSPEHKPRVFFTCHPDNFSKYFEKICEDIFKTHDCAIFYTEDLNEEIEEKYKESDLGQMNLFVIPVTFKLLSKPNRAMDSDFRYAQEKHIPVLPIMMEPGLDTIYSQEDKFGELQYLNPYAQDLTAISYEEKLKKYLESVLISNEMVERIRKAFDAYIFLSYRKKDRHYANELMKMIHSHLEFRDIAIWYDEFLTPGESFRENIERMMKDSKLFALLVTPSLLEYVDGKPNYVMAHEYPDAKMARMDILPTEMEATDKDELYSKFEGIPACVNPEEDEAFKKRLAETLSRIAVLENKDDPEHNFLIGLAYFEGIDVEVNRERGIELITSAAENNLEQAMLKIFDIYNKGINVQINLIQAEIWAKKIEEYYSDKYGEKDPKTLFAIYLLTVAYVSIGKYEQAVEWGKKDYELRRIVLGEEHPDTLTTMEALASAYNGLENYKKALEMFERVYTIRCKTLGEEDPCALNTLHNIAFTYGKLGYHKKALKLQKKIYSLLCKIHGAEHPNTLSALNNLAVTYGKNGNHKQALDLQEKLVNLQQKVLKDEDPSALITICNLAKTYTELGKYTQALDLQEAAYSILCRVCGEEHPNSLNALSNLVILYRECSKEDEENEAAKKLYHLNCKIYGENHPRTLEALIRVALTLDDYRKAISLLNNTDAKQHIKIKCKLIFYKNLFRCGQFAIKSIIIYRTIVYGIKKRLFGKTHKKTLHTYLKLAYLLGQSGYHNDSIQAYKEIYADCCAVLEEKSYTAATALHNMAWNFSKLNDIDNAIIYYEKAHLIKCEVFGIEAESTRKTLTHLNKMKKKQRDLN